MKEYKRQYRQLSDETKNRNKQKTKKKKQRIRQAMIQYWKTVPNKPNSLSMDDYLKRNDNDR